MTQPAGDTSETDEQGFHTAIQLAVQFMGTAALLWPVVFCIATHQIQDWFWATSIPAAVVIYLLGLYIPQKMDKATYFMSLLSVPIVMMSGIALRLTGPSLSTVSLVMLVITEVVFALYALYCFKLRINQLVDDKRQNLANLGKVDLFRDNLYSFRNAYSSR